MLNLDSPGAALRNSARAWRTTIGPGLGGGHYRPFEPRWLPVKERAMIQLTNDHVRLHVQAVSKVDAIGQAGRVLAQNGNIAPGYVESMLGRELQANTYLGNGIAIPH